MNIHEFQAKSILKSYGVPVPEGKVATSANEARAAAEELGTKVVVVKAQIHAGGRGKAGGVKLAKSPAEAEKLADEILGSTLITHQTGPAGRVVRKVLVEQGLDIERELYLGIVIDRSKGCPVLIAASEGGVEIEELARNRPEALLHIAVDPAMGLLPFQARRVALHLGLSGDSFKNGVKCLTRLFGAFNATDASLAEINPLVVTRQGEVLALDAKMNFDDSALFRQSDILGMRDLDEEEPLEIEASKFSLNYIKLDGNVGCMVNGAGLAMSTMDIIKLAGGEPANFLDVGGGADVEQVSNAFRILMSDPNVRAVLINIFGGIVRCDRIATGVVEALSKVKVDVPVVVRLEGTNVEQGLKILEESDLSFLLARGMKDAADKVVGALKDNSDGGGAL